MLSLCSKLATQAARVQPFIRPCDWPCLPAMQQGSYFLGRIGRFETIALTGTI